jgi:lipoate---protein ligase
MDIPEMITMKRFEYKVPGGKLIRVKLEIEDNIIRSIQLTGDFFMLPENDLEELETKLIGLQSNPQQIERTVIAFFTNKKTTIAGASSSDFAYVINQALRS